MVHFHGKYSDFATQENYVEDTCAINTSSSSSFLRLHTKLMVEVAQLLSVGVLGMEVWDLGDPPHNHAKFKALPCLGFDQNTNPPIFRANGYWKNRVQKKYLPD
jgi:hypothetical protein